MGVGGINTNAALYYANSKNVNEVSTAMLDKTLDAQKVEGNGLLKMMDAAAMERSVNPAVGGNFDLSV